MHIVRFLINQTAFREMEERVLRNFAKTLEGGNLRGGVLSTFEDNFERSNQAPLKSQTQMNSR